jgi:hypothetical protein
MPNRKLMPKITLGIVLALSTLLFVAALVWMFATEAA